MFSKNRSIAFIGGGQITEIIVENLTGSEVVSPEHIIVSDPSADRCDLLARRFSVSTTPDNGEAVRHADLIFINVRPQVVPTVIAEFKQFPVPEQKVIISLAAGIPIKAYRVLGEKRPIARALPNPPSQVGKGIIALTFNTHVSDAQKEEILTLFRASGEVILLDEEKINAMTVLSSPVIFYYFFEALIDAGVKIGLDRGTSTKITYRTIVGSMEVWKQRRVQLSELIKEACTPGGVSVEMVQTIEESGLRAAFCEALNNGAKKAEQLGK